jgi:tetratricopeptide (TPR) repeat protein
MNIGAYEPALEVLDAVIQKAPEFAEGWNRRATILFVVGLHDRSLKDCEEVLRREPRHFGALVGMAMIAIAQGRYAAALDTYRRALMVNPYLKERQEIIPALERKVEGQPL